MSDAADQTQRGVTVADAGPQGMITLRGDLSDPSLQAVCTKITGAAMPAERQISLNGPAGIGWMSPDEVLLLVPSDTVDRALTTLDTTLQGTHHLAVNVSDARALFTLDGPYAREVVAKLAPADLSAANFAVGELRRTRLGQVAAAFWMSDAMTVHVICFRSVAGYTQNLLQASASAGPVGYFDPATG